MRLRLLAILISCLLTSPLAQAWNAAGHRLSALIAWQYMSPASQNFVTDVLARHPDYPSWQDKARRTKAEDILVEASTWADQIRHDPRFYDERRAPPTPAIAGLSDHARHKPWHYLDRDSDGTVRAGELDRRIDDLIGILRTSQDQSQLAWALPWLIHLVGDIHQPLHVGRHGDSGGNAVDIENPRNLRQPVISLHQYWDELPGPPWLRGKRLEQNARYLLEIHQAPTQGHVAVWRDESHRLLNQVYPPSSGALPALIDEAFHRQARHLANRRIVDAGSRLGRLLDRIVADRVSRETP